MVVLSPLLLAVIRNLARARRRDEAVGTDGRDCGIGRDVGGASAAEREVVLAARLGVDADGIELQRCADKR